MIEAKFLALVVAAALNPLVVRSPEPHGAVPADCEVSTRPPMTRVTEAEPPEAIPLPPVKPAPRATAATTATGVKELQRALAANDREAYDAALARARAAGGATRVYEDIARLWDAQFESPFFAEGSEPHRIGAGYSGYEEAMRRQVFTDARGRKFYPAAESRAFVARQVGVTSLGPAPARPAPATRRASAEPAPTPSRRTPALSSSRKSTSSPSTSKSASGSRMPVARRQPAASEAPHPIPSAPSPAAAAEPAPVVPSAVVDDPATAAAPPAAGRSDTAVTTVTEPAAPDTAATDTATTDTATTIPVSADAPAAAAGVPATPAAAPKGRSIVLPAILILIGLGVLIVLFRTAR